MDMMFWSSLSFQNVASVLNSNLESFHDLVMVWLVVILCLVLILSFMILLKKKIYFLKMDSMTLEITWTIFPILILISIAFPSILLLCNQDTSYLSPKLSIKLLSSQWSWLSDQSEEIDHLLDSFNKLDYFGNFKSPLVAPFSECCRIFLTSSDVLHSLGVPSFGLKLDSVPGRLNAVTIEPFMMGLHPGSCYELCGSGHSAMPFYFLVF